MPVLDEALRIDAALDALGRTPGIHEVIVVDGGSRDETAAIVRRHAGVRFVEVGRGRGGQQNAGARCARGDVLLFLHADVTLPREAAAAITGALADAAVVAGAFRTRTLTDRPSWLARWLWLADIRSRVTRFPYGDQALFVRRGAFEAVGGFPDQPLMEDVELARRLARAGRVVTLREQVAVSGRRFLAHPLRTIVMMRTFPLLYRLGVSPDRLARLYGSPR